MPLLSAGSPLVRIGVNTNQITSVPGTGSTTLDAANEACIYIGQIVTSDGASHTIDTTGSSALQWRSGAVTFANGSTVVKIGLAAVDTATGPVGRAVNVADVITFDVNAAPVGGGGGITANAWISSVPTAGTKTVSNGDFLAFAVQMTARGGVADTIAVTTPTVNSAMHRPLVTSFTGGSYAAVASTPNCIITFSDGALGYFYGGDVCSTVNARIWNTGGAVDEYGQLFNLPYSTKIYGIYGWGDFDNNADIILYSDPLGTPAAEKTVSIDLNTVAATSTRRFEVLFASPYTYRPNTDIVAAFSPGASNITAFYKTLNHAGHRISETFGTTGYGVSRAVTGAGAFSDANSSLDHYYIGLLVGAFEHGVWPGGHLGV
jgi:hypothetical protein